MPQRLTNKKIETGENTGWTTKTIWNQNQKIYKRRPWGFKPIKFLQEMSMMRSGVMKYEFKYRVPYYILKSMSNRQIKKKTIFNDS